MKNLNLVTLVALLAIGPAAYAQKDPLPPPPTPPPAPPRDYIVEPPPPRLGTPATPPPAQPPQVFVYDQKPVTGRPVLVTQEQAQAIINRFKAAYPGMGSPRFLIYVNRELVDEQSGMKLIRRDERIESTRNSNGTNGATVKSIGDNTYRADDKAQLSLADKQTVRDVERLFGRPLRAAGASLADQRVAAELIADKPLDEFIGTTDTPQARKDREALAKITDAVIEVLISSKTITVPTISSSQTVTIPDIQATAISLKDSKIIGQTSSAEVTTRVPPATLGNFDVREISEATALQLMDDMAPETK
jgi:hypothetical protein